ALEQTIREQYPDRIRSVPDAETTRRGGGLPPVTDEYLDGMTHVEQTVAGQKRRLGGPFEIPTDPGWVSCLVAKAIRGLKGKHAFVDRLTHGEIGNEARLVLVGDWGTGIPRAKRVADSMRKIILSGLDDGREQHAVHLGDVY